MEEKIERRKLSDEVLDRLLKTIEAGELRPGDQLPSERELMARYGVGRPAVREALQALEKMGLIEISHGERARLISLDPRGIFDLIDRSARHLLQTSPQTLEHLSEARLFFEVGMVRLAIQRTDDRGIQLLADRLQALRRNVGRPEAFVTTDMAFHTTIANLAGNPIFTTLSEFMLRWLFQYYPKLVTIPGAEELTVREHEAIYQAVAARDEEAAVRAITEHLTRANPQYATLIAAAFGPRPAAAVGNES